MMLTEDIVNQARNYPNQVIPFSRVGKSLREIIQLAKYRPAALEQYMEASIESARRAERESASDKEFTTKMTHSLGRLWLEEEITTQPQAVVSILRALDKVVPLTIPMVLEGFVGECLRRYDFNEAGPSFAAVCQMEGMMERRDLYPHPDPHCDFGILEIVFRWASLMEIEAGGRWDDSLKQRRRRTIIEMMDMALAHGAELDRSHCFLKERTYRPVTYQGLLHQACSHHDSLRMHGKPETLISMLINLGADWKKLLDEDLVDGQAREIIMNHPRVKKHFLLESIAHKGTFLKKEREIRTSPKL